MTVALPSYFLSRGIMEVNGQNIRMYRGDTLEVEIYVVDCNESPLDLTTYSGVGWVVYRPTTKDIVIQKSLGSGINVYTPASGIINIDINPSDTEALLPGRYIHECKIWSAPDEEYTVSTGSFELYYSRQ